MKTERMWLHMAAVATFAVFGIGANDMSLGCCGGGGGNYPYAPDAAADVGVADDAALDDSAALSDSAAPVDGAAADASVD